METRLGCKRDSLRHRRRPTADLGVARSPRAALRLPARARGGQGRPQDEGGGPLRRPSRRPKVATRGGWALRRDRLRPAGRGGALSRLPARWRYSLSKAGLLNLQASL